MSTARSDIISFFLLSLCIWNYRVRRDFWSCFPPKCIEAMYPYSYKAFMFFTKAAGKNASTLPARCQQPINNLKLQCQHICASGVKIYPRGVSVLRGSREQLMVLFPESLFVPFSQSVVDTRSSRRYAPALLLSSPP